MVKKTMTMTPAQSLYGRDIQAAGGSENGTYDPVNGKSKIALLFIEAFGGLIGLDRLYMNCFLSGFFKFFLFVIAWSMMYVNYYAFAVFAILSLGWFAIDAVWVFWNVFTKKKTTPFGSSERWGEAADVNQAPAWGVGIILVLIMSIVLAGVYSPQYIDAYFGNDANTATTENREKLVGGLERATGLRVGKSKFGVYK